MERRELEDRIRASLQARADDVQPTPELWERVAEQTTRRARWQVAGWALSGAAAVLALVVGGLVLFGSPRGVQIDPQPDMAETPDQTPVPGDSADATIVATDGRLLYVIEPGTGEVVAELDPRAGLQEAAEIREVVVRPVSDEGVLTVAMTLQLEGEFDVEVAAFDADGQQVDRLNLGMAASATEPPPAPVWSADGRYVMWAGTNGPSSPALWAYDWVERPVDADGIAQPTTATAPGADGELFADGATVDLHTWTGPADGESVVIATTPTGQAWQVALAAQGNDCAGASPCYPTWQVAISPIGFEGGSLVDVATLDNGVELALVARSGQAGDAEGATLQLLAGPMGDQQRELEIPELTAGTAAPTDGWLAAAGDQVAVGFGPQTAHLLTVEGTTVEDVEVAGTATLPEGTMAAGTAVLARDTTAVPVEVEVAEPATDTPAVADDGLPSHVVVAGPAEGRMALVDRIADRDVATWQRPDGLVVEAVPAQVVVHPTSTPQHLEVVTRWTVGEAETLSRTVVRDGQVLVNEALPADRQPDNQGTIAELAESGPVFSPTGDWLAWVDTPQGADGPVQLRILPWGDQGPAGNASTVAVPADVVRPQELLDWATSPDGDVLTFRPQAGPDESFDQPAAMVEFRLAGADPRVGQWATVELPGVLFDAGSFPLGDGEQRYVAFDGGNEVLYGLAEAPRSAVPTGAFGFSEGRVVAFGPDSALVQQPDGSWQRVQVDDGATSSVDVPDGTVAVLPWPDEA